MIVLLNNKFMDNEKNKEVVELPINQALSMTCPPVKVSDWLLTLLITCIPLVGFIMLFVWAFGNQENLNKSNWAKANLLFMLIFVILGALISLMFFSFLVAAFR